jgi:hypothetical protein
MTDKQEFYIVRCSTSYEAWVKNLAWNNEDGDPIDGGYHKDYATLLDAMDELKKYPDGQVLVFSSVKPYRLLNTFQSSFK